MVYDLAKSTILGVVALKKFHVIEVIGPVHATKLCGGVEIVLLILNLSTR